MSAELRVQLLQRNYDIMARIPRFINIARNSKLRSTIAIFIICVVCYLTISLAQRFPIIFEKKQPLQRALVHRNSSHFIPPAKNETHLTTDKTTQLHATTADAAVVDEFTTKAIEPEKFVVVDEYQTVRVPHPSDGPFTVASHFWELASTNTKQIFDVVPGDFLPQFKNPCFWETYTPRRDPYAGSPYAPKVGETYKYDPWGHTGYYKRARDRFPGHLQHNKTTNQYKRLRCLPYFYLISTPKSGTTTLWNQLNKHPEVDMRIGIKENAWWNFMRNGVNGEHHWVYHLVPPAKTYIPNPDNLQTFDQFLDLFDNEAMDFYDLSLHQNYVNNITALAPINMLTAPIDFWNLLYPSLTDAGFDSPPNILHPAYIIHKIQPNAKFVAILRNPTDRLYSDWEFFNKAHDRVAFHTLAVHALRDFKACTDKFTNRHCLYDYSIIARSLRLGRGAYAPFLKDLFNIFPKNQVLVLPFDYFTMEQYDATNEILRFLNLTEIDNPKHILKKAYYDRWFIPKEDRIMLPETKKMLDEFYAPYNEQLADLMSDQRFLFPPIIPNTTETDDDQSKP